MAAVLKTAEGDEPFGGSNPSGSAKMEGVRMDEEPVSKTGGRENGLQVRFLFLPPVAWFPQAK